MFKQIWNPEDLELQLEIPECNSVENRNQKVLLQQKEAMRVV